LGKNGGKGTRIFKERGGGKGNIMTMRKEKVNKRKKKKKIHT